MPDNILDNTPSKRKKLERKQKAYKRKGLKILLRISTMSMNSGSSKTSKAQWIYEEEISVLRYQTLVSTTHVKI